MSKRLSAPPFSPAKDPAQYPLFTGAISRWVWRIYTQRLTPAGRWFAVATALFIAYGGASIQLQGYVLGLYASTLWAVAIGAMLLYRPRVRLTARMATRVCAGETLPVDLEVEQLTRLRGADLLVLPHQLPAAIDAVPEQGTPLPDLAKNTRASVRLGLRCSHRGAYTVPGFRVETGFPFGMLRARRTFREPRQLLVYPHFTPLGRLTLPTGRRYQPGGVALASQVGESFEYLGNREYRQGDNVRDIDWRATARSPRPVVREWVEEYMLRVAVVLDTHVGHRVRGSGFRWRPPFLNPEPSTLNPGSNPHEAFERAVSVAASVSDYMARQDYLVDLFAAGPDLYHLTAGRSLAYLDQILDILACVDESPVEPFATIEPQVAELLSRISTVICVLLDWDDARRNFAHRLHAQGVAVKIIILRDGPCTLDPADDAPHLGPITTVTAADYSRGFDEL
jgi:uncharacterized protein (DUF58 family)